MKNCYAIIATLVSVASLLFAETNAVIEVKLFKDWVIDGERSFVNLAIKNTGTDPISLAKDPFDFEIGQLFIRSLPHKPIDDSTQEQEYQMVMLAKEEFFNLFPGETHVYEGRKFVPCARIDFSEEIRFTVSVYLGKGVWLDSEPLTHKGITPDAEEPLAVDATNDAFLKKLAIITYKNERWLYSRGYPNPQLEIARKYCYPVCPLSLTNKIRAEPYEGNGAT